MAAPRRRRREESDLTAGNGELPSRNPLEELVLNRSQGEDVDRSILAIFEDSAVSSEGNNSAEEATESLLCALTEMLDRVGQEDDDGIFSPFDVLPNTDLLHGAERTQEPLQEPPPPLRLRLRPKPLNETAGTRLEAEQTVERTAPPQTSKKQNQRKAKAEVEVFTSTSLVSLVKLMHPYCLNLHVEKQDNPRRNHPLFSQEEVWRYERPSGESDEEINVVSDEEAPLEGTKEEEAGGSRGSGSALKSVLMHGKSSIEKKKVSFGPVHVASFDVSEEDDWGQNANSSERTIADPSGSALEPLALSLERKEEVTQEERQEKKKKGETKAKSLSLQEYRQLRLNRRPPVEKQSNYTTRWPSVSELPKELTPILPLRLPNTTECSSLSQQSPDFTEAKLCNHLYHGRLKSSNPELSISPTSPLPDNLPKPSMSKPERRRSPVKKPKLLSSDPPNPVLVPMPLPQTPSDSVSMHSSKHLQKIQNESSVPPHPRSPDPTLNAPSPLNKDCKARDSPLSQELKAEPPCVLPESAQERGQSRAEQPSSPDPGRQPSPAEAHMRLKQEFTETTKPEPPQSDCRENNGAVQSGIEASDLTSLLEQFEETQAIEDSVCKNEAKPVHATSSSLIEAKGRVSLDRPEAAGSEQSSPSPLKPTVESVKPLRADGSPNAAQTLDVPEPLRTEIVLSSQKNQPVRCKSLSLKAIQIIDPRPLPSRKVRTSQPEPSAPQTSAQIYSRLCSDHDYCGSVDHYPPQAKQPSEAISEPELRIQESGAAGDQKSDDRALEPLHGSDPSRMGSESDSSADEALQFFPRAPGQEGDSRTALCGLPTPPPTPPVRGRSKRRYRRRSPRSDSSSSSCSCSPKRQRVCRRRSQSSSCSSSPSSCATSYSRSRSWSRSRSRSPTPQIHHRRWRDVSASRESRRRSREREMRIQKLKAIDERRVVYVGRIRRTMTDDELRERFSQLGEVECVSLHFRDGGNHYGFVTFYNTEDAFAAIDNGGKLRKPDELPFDLCFGGRRQFCNSNYADLDANREADPPPPRSRFEDVDFDSLLKQAQRGMRR